MKEEAIPKSEVTPQISFEDLITPEHLAMISQTSDGFSFAPDPRLAQEFETTGIFRLGYTNLATKRICFNPLAFSGVPEVGLQPWGKKQAEGFAYHEVGHHVEKVLDLDHLLSADLKNPAIIPEAYRGSPDSEMRFLQALSSHLHNALLDVWLESYLGRRPYYPIRESIEATARSLNFDQQQTLTSMSKPEQLIQSLLASRYYKMDGLEQKVEPDVHQAYQKVIQGGAMEALQDTRTFENYFATEEARQKAIERKFLAYQQVFLPEYLKLMVNELEERKKEKERQKQEGSQGNQAEDQSQQGQPESGMKGEGKSEQEQSQDQNQGQNESQSKQEGNQPGTQPGGTQAGEKKSTSPSRAPSEAVPLNKEEEEELIQQILEELEKAGQQFKSQAPSTEEEKQKAELLEEIKKELKERQKATKEGKQTLGGETKKEAEEPDEKGLERIHETSDALQREQRRQKLRGLAEAMQVKQASVERWERIKQKYQKEIESTAAVLTEVFVDDRRKKLDFLRREGEIVPGLEFETIAALISGELDPDTKMRIIQNPQFLETEIEFIVDTSGSMEGEKLRKSVDLLVIVTEAFKKARETLAEENLLSEDEQPFRIGVTKFSTFSERVTKLEEPLEDKKEVRIVDNLSYAGGGTDETQALKETYRGLTLNKNNVIKIIIVLSDGQGNKEGVASIMGQIEKDDEVIFLAIGLGDQASEVVETYLEPLKSQEKNVFGNAAENPDQAIPAVLDFLKREAQKRKLY